MSNNVWIKDCQCFYFNLTGLQITQWWQWRLRDKARELRRTRDKQQEKGRQQQQQFKAAQDELAHINEKINVMKGPFRTRFDNTLTELSFKHLIYHKGALVGNDVAKILQQVPLCALFKLLFREQDVLALATGSQ